MTPATAVEWDVDTIINDGVVAVRDLSQHTTQVIKAVEARGRPVLVTRNGRVVASIAPITMREVVDQIVANHSDVRDSLTEAEKALKERTTQPISKLPLDSR
jgi:prevent-host-death family protein